MLTPRQEIDRVLGELGALVGASLKLNAEGVIVIEFADDVTCTIEVPDHTERVFVQLGVGRLPREGREPALAAALERNRFGLDVAGACLALDETSEELLLCHSLPSDPPGLDNFSETLVALIGEVADLRTLLRAGPRSPDGQGEEFRDAPPGADASTLFFRG